jgi:hypothetical protein
MAAGTGGRSPPGAGRDAPPVEDPRPSAGVARLNGGEPWAERLSEHGCRRRCTPQCVRPGPTRAISPIAVVCTTSATLSDRPHLPHPVSPEDPQEVHGGGARGRSPARRTGTDPRPIAAMTRSAAWKRARGEKRRRPRCPLKYGRPGTAARPARGSSHGRVEQQPQDVGGQRGAVADGQLAQSAPERRGAREEADQAAGHEQGQPHQH